MQNEEGCRQSSRASRRSQLDSPTPDQEEKQGQSEKSERASHPQTLADKVRRLSGDLRKKVQERPGEEMTDVKWYMKPGLAVLGAAFGAIVGALLGEAGVVGGLFLGAAVGIKLGAGIGGAERPKENSGRKRRHSIEEPDRNF